MWARIAPSSAAVDGLVKTFSGFGKGRCVSRARTRARPGFHCHWRLPASLEYAFVTGGRQQRVRFGGTQEAFGGVQPQGRAGRAVTTGGHIADRHEREPADAQVGVE